MNQILSQDEINAILQGISDGEVDATSEGGKQAGFRTYDLASQERIIRGRMPTLELIHDRFTRSFRGSLSKFLGRSCFVNVGAIEIVKFGAFMKTLPLPSSLHIYRMPPLQGYALMVLSTPLVYGVIDSLFGGRGSAKVKNEGREYTAIETRLIGKVVHAALDNLKEAWAPVHPVDFIYSRSEFNPLAVALVPPTDMVITITIEVELEQESTSLTLCTPYSTIEPIRQKLTTGLQSSRLEVDSSIIRRMEGTIRKTETNLTVELARGTIAMERALQLKVGDIVGLETSPSEEAIIKVEGVAKYRGFVGSSRGSRAVKVSRAVMQEEDESVY
jgi:flagellar motor switch protein FliM